MKNNNRIMALLRTAALCFVVAAMSACDAEEFTRTAGDIPGDKELTTAGGLLRREKTLEPISMLKIDEGQPAVDAVFYQLSQPAKADVTVTIDIDEKLVADYNRDRADAAKLTLFPVDKVSFTDGKTLTIAKGESVSGKLNLTFSREGVENGMYVLPLRASAGDQTLNPTAKNQIIYYRVVVFKHVPESELDAWKFKVVGYVNTEEMNPLMCNEIFVWTFDMFSEEEGTKTWLDISVLRKASIKFNAENGRAMLDLGPDLQYVLSSRDRYVVPIQKASRKILLGITGGNTGLGFCNMSDAQITEFVYQLKYVVDTYHLDGVNFFDMEANYGKDGMPAIAPASYPKLIKATKEALGEKLVTIACDSESNEILAVAQGGVDAGQYIDYAWSGVFDTVVDPWADDATAKPIAGLEQSKYGSLMMKTHDTGWMAQNADAMRASYKEFYFQHPESANIFAFWDMPTSNAGMERGVGDAIGLLLEAITDDNAEYDGMVYDFQPTDDLKGYGKFVKDW